MFGERERLARLRLARTPGIGPLTFSKFLETYGSGETSLEALPSRLAKSGQKSIAVYSPDKASRELELTSRLGAKIIFSGEADYPEALAAIYPPPPLISAWGDLSILKRPSIAMVGSRNASAASVRIAGDMAHELGQAGYVVSSGLARGVDTASHRGALSTGTIAVIAGGIDNIYPPQNRELRDEISKLGLVISETAFGHEPRAKDFPRRNRLITGLSLGVVVVEAAMRSGSLISARTALEQGREVMAVPGSPLDPRNRGSNQLIRSGATLVETAEDVISTLAPMQHRQKDLFEIADTEPVEAEDIEMIEEDRIVILSALSPVPMTITDIAAASNLSIRVCASHLVELELSGLAFSMPGGLVQKAV